MIRFLYGRPLETLLATWGVSLILQQAGAFRFSAPLNREVGTPEWMSWLHGDRRRLSCSPLNRALCIILFSLAGLRGPDRGAFMQRTRLRPRDAGRHPEPVDGRVHGHPHRQVDALTFGLGAGIAGVAGVALSQISDNVSPNLGQALHRRQRSWWWCSAASAISGARWSAPSPWASSTSSSSPSPGAVLGQDPRPGVHHPVHPEAPARLFALKGRAAGELR